MAVLAAARHERRGVRGERQLPEALVVGSSQSCGTALRSSQDSPRCESAEHLMVGLLNRVMKATMLCRRAFAGVANIG